jgi:hypothetical protein
MLYYVLCVRHHRPILSMYSFSSSLSSSHTRTHLCVLYDNIERHHVIMYVVSNVGVIGYRRINHVSFVVWHHSSLKISNSYDIRVAACLCTCISTKQLLIIVIVNALTHSFIHSFILVSNSYLSFTRVCTNTLSVIIIIIIIF